jgi:hypothetical protein
VYVFFVRGIAMHGESAMPRKNANAALQFVQMDVRRNTARLVASRCWTAHAALSHYVEHPLLDVCLMKRKNARALTRRVRKQ